MRIRGPKGVPEFLYLSMKSLTVEVEFDAFRKKKKVRAKN